MYIRADCWVAAITKKKRKRSIVRHSHRVGSHFNFFFLSSGSFYSLLRCDEQTIIEFATFRYFRFVFWHFIYKFAPSYVRSAVIIVKMRRRKTSAHNLNQRVACTGRMIAISGDATHSMSLSTVWIGKKAMRKEAATTAQQVIVRDANAHSSQRVSDLLLMKRYAAVLLWRMRVHTCSTNARSTKRTI